MEFVNVLNIVIQALIAVGTVGAVLISVYYSHKAVSRKRKLWITQQFTEHFSEGYINLIVTIENMGNVPVILSKIGTTDGVYKNIINTEINKYLVSDEKLTLIKPNEAAIIEYKKKFDVEMSVTVIEKLRETPDYKFLSEAVFYSEDTTGKRYPEELNNKLKKNYTE